MAALVAAIAAPTETLAADIPAQVEVPFVGCASDGQMGPAAAPRAVASNVRLPAPVARRLAFFKTQYSGGVLGPRDWRCIGLSVSNGDILFVTPQALTAADLLGSTASTIAGPAIQLSTSLGETSGRFEVARVVARVFPAERDFVQRVIAEGIEPASALPFGPYPADRLTYKTNRIVEFRTPAGAEGLGTRSRLLRNNDPIDGVAILSGSAPDLHHLVVRLPPNQRDLTADIVRQLEQGLVQ